MKSFEELIQEVETNGYLLCSLYLVCDTKGAYRCDLRKNNELMTIKSGLGWTPAEALSNAMTDQPRIREDDTRNPFPYMSKEWKEWCRGSGTDYPRIVRSGSEERSTVKPKKRLLDDEDLF